MDAANSSSPKGFTYYWYCLKCNIHSQPVNSVGSVFDIASWTNQRILADQHDIDTHNGKPLSNFGFEISW